MSIPTQRFTRIVAGLLVSLIANMFVWAAHADTPVPHDNGDGAPVFLNVHEHQEGDSGKIVEHCDHCCHAASHLLGLKTPASITLVLLPSVRPEMASPAHADAPQAPPYIPPIA